MSRARRASWVCAQAARVVGLTRVCREHVKLEFVLPVFPASDPGQFLQVLCAGEIRTATSTSDASYDESPSVRLDDAPCFGAFLRRPFSIADRWEDEAGQTHLVVISRGVGVGTRWLERRRLGDTLNITGPLGHGFSIPAHDVPIVLVGGGVGIPPLLYLTRRLHELGHDNVTAVFGVTTRELLPLRVRGEPATDGTPCRCVELPGGASFSVIITTDDGSLGMAGVVTDALEQQGKPDGSAVLACGPEPMLRAVAAWTRARKRACQLCIERTMGCGIGTCLSCVVRVLDPSRPAGWRWALACSDGPVFERDTLLDYGVGSPS